MIEKLRELVIEYETEILESSYDIILQKEQSTLKNLNERTFLLNEKIKISDTFTHYVIERCKPSEVSPLRHLVEEYEEQIELFKDNYLDSEEYIMLRNITVVLDLLLGIDISYYSNLYELINQDKIEELIDYFEQNISFRLSYDDIYAIIKGRRLKL